MNQGPSQLDAYGISGERSLTAGFDNEDEREWIDHLTPSYLEEFQTNYEPEQQRSSQDFPKSPSHSILLNNNRPMSRHSSNYTSPNSHRGTPGLPPFEILTEISPRLGPPFRPLDPPSFDSSNDTPRSYTPFPRLDTPPQPSFRNRRSIKSPSNYSTTTPHSSSNDAFVDLTSDSHIMPQPHRGLKSNHRPSFENTISDTPNPAKRRKTLKTEIQEVDLRDVESDTDLVEVLEKQRVNTIKAQQEEANRPTKLANLTCVVCMEEMTNMTATHCGTSSLLSKEIHQHAKAGS